MNFLPEIYNFYIYGSCSYYFVNMLTCHDLGDRLIRFTHSLLCKLSDIADCIFYTFFYESVFALELLSIFLHLKSQKPCFKLCWTHGIKKDKFCFKLTFSHIISFPSLIPAFSGYAFFLMFSMIFSTTEISVSNSSAITSGVLFLANFFSTISVSIFNLPSSIPDSTNASNALHILN